MQIKKLILYLFVAGLGWTWSGEAQATEISLQFAGQIILSTISDPALASGAGFTGVLIYNLSEEDQAVTDPSYGQYPGISLTVSFSTEATATCVGQPSIIVRNNFARMDSFTVDADFAITGSSPHLTFVNLNLLDDNQTVLTTDSLPGSLSLSEFDRKLFMLVCKDSGEYAAGTIGIITFEAIPLPASLLLFGTGLGGWLAAGIIRRSKRFF